MPDYEKFVIRAMDIAHSQGINVADPDSVEPIAKEVAEEYFVDEEKLVAIVRQRAKEYTDAGVSMRTLQRSLMTTLRQT
jgi:hypothetical protein